MGRSTVPDHLPLGRSSQAWRVNAEPLVFAGGGRALLMQVAHPKVGAGVEQHSTYASDPWGRLFRTIDIMMKLSFGSPEVSRRQEETLREMHRKVTGRTASGSAYTAFDPALQLWVWATLVDTALKMYELVHGRLRDGEREQFYAESKLVAYGCGVPQGRCPASFADFEAYVAGVVADDLEVTDAARAVAVASMVPPLPAGVGRLAAVPNRLVTVGLLPSSLREEFGFEWSSRDQRRLDRWLAGARVVTRAQPAPLRQLGARAIVAQRRPPTIGWLQRKGAEMTQARLRAAGFGS